MVGATLAVALEAINYVVWKRRGVPWKLLVLHTFPQRRVAIDAA